MSSVADTMDGLSRSDPGISPVSKTIPDANLRSQHRLDFLFRLATRSLRVSRSAPARWHHRLRSWPGSLPRAACVWTRVLDERAVEPRHRAVRRTRAHRGHSGHVFHRASDRHPGELRDRAVPHRAVADLDAATPGHGDRASRRDPEHHLRHVGGCSSSRPPLPSSSPGSRPLSVQFRSRECSFKGLRWESESSPRDHPRDHGDPLHRRRDARCVRGRPVGAEGVGLRARLDDMGKSCGTWCFLHESRRSGRNHGWASAGPWARPWRSPSSSATRTRLNVSLMMPGNSIASALANEFTEAVGDLYQLGADRAGPDPVPDHFRGPFPVQDAVLRLGKMEGQKT